MITPLRKRHRWLAPVSFALGLGVLGAALAARPTDHVRAMRAAPRSEAEGSAEPTVISLTTPDGDVHSVDLRPVLPNVSGGASRRFVLDPAALDAPDLMLYALEKDSSVDGLPADAQFVCAASTSEPTEFEVGPRVQSVVLYSLGHARVVGTLPVQDPGGPR
ncbi:MAG: hypothetical protein AAFR54_05190 [Planctomycetota bacterium]